MNRKAWLLVGIALLCGAGTFALVEPVPQNQAYHRFADDRALLGIPNALDVLSNLPFLIVGLAGAWPPLGAMARQGLDAQRVVYAVFFVAFALVAFGSAHYHLAPSDATLVWDRLPITMAFMALLSIVIAELIGPTLALRLLPMFLLIGAFSVFYWDYTEQLGRGDLRLYGLVKFVPMLLIALMLIMYRRPPHVLGHVLAAAALYGAAVVFEAFDAAVYRALGVVSGHTLKHLFAAGAGLAILMMMQRRRPALLDSPERPAQYPPRS